MDSKVAKHGITNSEILPQHTDVVRPDNEEGVDHPTSKRDPTIVDEKAADAVQQLSGLSDDTGLQDSESDGLETEQDRLDLQHHLFLLTLRGKLHLAPIENMQLHNVMDIATGTGIWATDFASAFPSANVLGTDLSPIQPEYVPPNCHFEIDDAEDEWSFSYKFDYIHGRMLASCFKSHVAVFQSAFNALRPNGWLEIQDIAIPSRCIDDSMFGTAFERWIDLIKEGCAALGRDFGRVPQYKQYLQEIGFVDVVEKQLSWPIGTWAKTQRMKMLGAWCKENVLSGLQGWTMAVLTRGLGMMPAEVELLLMEVRNDINSNALHAYAPIPLQRGGVYG
ncbi:hypothetical protein G7Y89_g1041 [Cudoniella acicularis]|uniref:Methyltransferase n=1 Tax=Cudoniella acicularis TaxID=354080 RepID=A0A8H4W8B3_9HELO|nr:hypothetical protein G7Y89_g1041 [Cudoniella acicularis]